MYSINCPCKEICPFWFFLQLGAVSVIFLLRAWFELTSKNTVFCNLTCLNYTSACLSPTKSQSTLVRDWRRSKDHGTAQGWFSQWDQHISPSSVQKVFWNLPCKCRKLHQKPPCAIPPCPRHNHRQIVNIYPQSFASLQDIWKTEKSNLEIFFYLCPTMKKKII